MAQFEPPSRKANKKDKIKVKPLAFNLDEPSEPSVPLAETDVVSESQRVEKMDVESVSSNFQIPVIKEPEPASNREPAKEESPVLPRKLSNKDEKKTKQTSRDDSTVESILSTPILESKNIEQEDIDSVPIVEEQEVVGDERLLLSRKSSKNDNKKAKQSTPAWDKSTEAPENPSDITANLDISREETPIALLPVSEHISIETADTKMSLSTESQNALVDDLQDFSSPQKSNKNRKGKAVASTRDESIASSHEPLPIPNFQGSVNEQPQTLQQQQNSVSESRDIVIDELPALFDKQVLQSEPRIHSNNDQESELLNKPSSNEPRELAKDKDDIAPKQVEDDGLALAPSLTRNQSKKGKKKNGKAHAFTFHEPTTITPEEPIPTAEPIVIHQAPAHDSAPTFGKNDKKKAMKKTITFDPNTTEEHVDPQRSTDTELEVSAFPASVVSEPTLDKPLPIFTSGQSSSQKATEDIIDQTVPLNTLNSTIVDKDNSNSVTEDIPLIQAEPEATFSRKKGKHKSKAEATSWGEPVEVVELVIPMKQEVQESMGLSTETTQPATAILSNETKILKFAAMSEPDTPMLTPLLQTEEFQKKHNTTATVILTVPETVQLDEAKPASTISSPVLPTNPVAQPIPEFDLRAKSPEQNIDFAATVAAGLEESGFDTDLVFDDPSFHRSTSPQGLRDISPDEDIAAARGFANKSKFGIMGRTTPSPPPLSPKNYTIKEGDTIPPVAEVAAASTQNPSFNPMDILNDPVFTQPKSTLGELEEADPGELYTSSLNKKTKVKKKRGHVAEIPIEIEKCSVEYQATTHADNLDDTKVKDLAPSLENNSTSEQTNTINPIVQHQPVFEQSESSPTPIEGELETLSLATPKKKGKDKRSKKNVSLENDNAGTTAVKAPVIAAPMDVDLDVEPLLHSKTRENMPERPSLPSTFDDQLASTISAETTNEAQNDQPAKKSKKGKGKLKRTSTTQQTFDLEPPSSLVTSFEENQEQEQKLDRDTIIAKQQAAEAEEWGSSKKKGKKNKQEKVGSGTVLAAASATAIGAMILANDIPSRSTNDRQDVTIEESHKLPHSFNETELAGLEPVEIGDNVLHATTASKETTPVTLEDAVTTGEEPVDLDDEWAILSEKKGKKGKGGVEKGPESEKREMEETRHDKPLEGLGIEKVLSAHNHFKGVVTDRDIHVSQAAIPTPLADETQGLTLFEQQDNTTEPTSRELDEPTDEKELSPNKLPRPFAGRGQLKRREHPVSIPEAQSDEKRVHLTGPFEVTPTWKHDELAATQQPDMRSVPDITTAHPMSDQSLQDGSKVPQPILVHSPVAEPTWSFSGVRDSAVHVADSPLLPTTPQFQTNIRDSGYHDADHSPPIPQSPIERVEELGGKEKPRLKETKTHDTHVESVIEKNHAIEPRSLSPSFANISSPDPIDSATKERSSHLLDSSLSTAVHGRSPTTSSKSRPHNIAPIAAIAAVAAIAQNHRDVGDDSRSSETKDSKSRKERSEPSRHVSTSSKLREHSSLTREVKQDEPHQSIFGDPSKKGGKSVSHSTPSKHPQTPNAPLESIKESSPDDSPLHKKGRHISDVGAPERGLKSARRFASSPKPSSEQLKSVAPHTPTPSSRKPVAPPLDTSTQITPAKDSPWHQVHGGVDRSMTLSPARRLGHDQRSPPVTDPIKQRLAEQRSPSIVSDRSVSRHKTPEPARPLSAASNRSTTPSLRRIERSISGDLRAASRLGEAHAPGAKIAHPNVAGITLAAGATAAIIAGIASSSKYDPVRDKGKGRADMADVYEAWGEAQGSPMSPTRPPSVRKRQSMQIMDLHAQLEQLAAQNRSLEEGKAKAEESMQAALYQRQVDSQVITEAVEARDREIHEKEIDIGQLRDTVQRLQQEVNRLTDINNALNESNRDLANDTNERYAQLQAEGQHVQDQWQQSTRELEQLRGEHTRLTSGMQEALSAEIALALDDRNAEITRLNAELAAAKEKIKALQRQIVDTKKQGESFLVVRDEDYFDSACQQLCQHVQQWVLRFSKFSDTRACRLSSEVASDQRLDAATREKIETRLDNAILDGSDVDMLLADRVKRRDIFMSVVMTMIWEYVFTRYLFGMDREQRQKLKSLEKTLSAVGPTRAVAQWRAITLTLLSKRDQFVQQRAQDTEAVVHEIYSTLATLLPPPSHLQRQIQESLRNVMRLAVALSIEMRTQRAEYIMLPPLQPEYDTHGDLVAKVTFNASLMNERSGETNSNDDLEARGAVVKIVLFPLVVKKGDDLGEGEDEIVVCPAQVLVAKPSTKKIVRVLSGAMSIDSRHRSMLSVAPESSIMDLSGSNVI